MRFFRNESCGKCVPCRIGSQKMVEMLTGWTEGTGGAARLALARRAVHAMKLTSICGLGQVVHVPIASVMKHFPTKSKRTSRDRVPGGRLLPKRG